MFIMFLQMDLNKIKNDFSYLFFFSVVFVDPHIGRDNNRRTFDALLGEELRAKQMQLFTGSGPGPATFGKQV
jgi:hypothetical protein